MTRISLLLNEKVILLFYYQDTKLRSLKQNNLNKKREQILFMKLSIPRVKPIKGHEKKTELLNFLIRLNIFAIPLYIILYFNLSLPQLQYAIANITTYLLSSAGFSPSIDGLLISIPIRDGTWAAVISWDCTAWKSMLAFLALVIATNYKSGNKLKGLVLFIPLIFIVNIMRIFFMFYYVRTFDLQHYSLVHAVVWSWGMIAVILVFWIVWMKFFPAEKA